MDDSIPGAYPATPQGELEPATAAPVAPTTRHHRHHHHEHNKLHKPTDPRGHSHTDSGVGFTDLELAQAPDAIQKPRASSEVPAPTEFDLKPTTSTTPQDGDATSSQHVGNKEPGSGESDIRRSEDETKRNSPPPYWGDLPKAQRGGIYNTVTGHGSPGDDHAQHHHLPQRGGIYNSVAGHGSQDEESLRHIHSPPGDDVQPAPLPGITEEADEKLDLAVADTQGANVDRGLIPDAMGTSLPPSTVPAGPQPVVPKTHAPSSSPPRAFPLASHHETPQEARHASQETESISRDALLASAAAAGAGTIASERRDKPNKLKKNRGLSPEPGTKTERAERSSDEGSASGEKKHHKMFGIFHRRKDSKGEKEMESSEPRAAESARSSAHREAPVATAVGTHRLSHHHKDEKKAKEERSRSEPSKPQPDTRDRTHRMSLNQTVAAEVAESAGAFGVLYQKPEAADETENLARNRADESAPDPPARSSKRRSLTPPTSAAVSELSTRYSSIPDATTSPSPPGTAESSRRGTAKYSGVGAVAGLGASVFANDLEPPSASEGAGPRSSMTSPCGDMTPDTFESPRDPPPTPANAGKIKSPRAPASEPVSSRTTRAMISPGHYNTLASGTASGVKSPVKGSSDGSMHDSPEYNVLSSGTASGVKQSPSGDRTSSVAGSDEGGSDRGEYNVLPSGTPSGVKIGSRNTSRSSVPDGNHSFAKRGDGQRNTSASGIPSGIDAVNWGPGRRAENEARDANRTLVAASIPSHDKSVDHSYPSPEAARHMSPEVLPESYRASSHPVPAAEHTGQPASEEKRDNATEQSHGPEGTARDAGAAIYTHKAGPSYGIDTVRVMHTCESCGFENDISSEFTTENIAKMNKKQGSTGNWWQNAWTSV